MKKKILIVALVALCLSMGTMGTLAFKSSEKKTDNVITTGNVEIKVLETRDDGSPYPEEAQKVMPSNEKSKIVNIENTGSVDAWVRVHVGFSYVSAEGNQLSGKVDNVDIATIQHNEGWTKGEDGYYYYNEPLAPGAKTATPLFEKVSFSEKMGNEYQGASIDVNVSAEGVQSKNNGTAVLEAKGWPAEK